LLHYTVVIYIRLLTSASSIRQKVQRSLIILWYQIFYGKTTHNKIAD